MAEDGRIVFSKGEKADPNGSWWILVDPNGSWWILVDPNGSWWILVDPNESWWILVDPNGSWWILVDPDGSWWLLMDPGSSWWLRSGSTRIYQDPLFPPCFFPPWRNYLTFSVILNYIQPYLAIPNYSRPFKWVQIIFPPWFNNSLCLHEMSSFINIWVFINGFCRSCEELPY
jgi:hypothetical protein